MELSVSKILRMELNVEYFNKYYSLFSTYLILLSGSIMIPYEYLKLPSNNKHSVLQTIGCGSIVLGNHTKFHQFFISIHYLKSYIKSFTSSIIKIIIDSIWKQFLESFGKRLNIFIVIGRIITKFDRV